LAEYFERVFLSSPWVDKTLSSLVYEDEAGRLCGFQGVIPRPLVFQGERIRAATATQLMVAPGSRGRGVATRLLAELFEGPQDFTLMDASNDAARRLWERGGASTVTTASLFWAKPLRPMRYAIREGTWGPMLGRAMRAGRPVWGLVDRLLTCVSRGPFRQVPPQGVAGPLDARGLVEHLPAVASRYAVRPDYDEVSLTWLLDQLAEKRRLGALRKRLVRDTSGEAAGWYIYFLDPGDMAQVVQIAARPGQYPLVVAHLSYEAWQGGAVGLVGRLDSALVEALGGPCRFFRGDGSWMLVHSKRPALVRAVHEGYAFLTRLDGEWWLSF
jgi:GNAT superfamily N-acetyltransferase